MTTKIAHLGQSIEASKVQNGILWVVQLYLGYTFAYGAYIKLTGDPSMVGLFQAIGLGQWFRYVTGSLEAIGAVLMLVPALAGVGGILLSGVMVGAIATHLFLVGGSPLIAIVCLVCALIVAAGRFNRTLKLVAVKP